MSDYEDQQRKKRLEDLEIKRKRLEEMRKLRKDRNETSSSSSSINIPSNTSTTNNSTSQQQQQQQQIESVNVDDLVNSLLNTTNSTSPNTINNNNNNNNNNSQTTTPNIISNINSIEEIRQIKRQQLSTVSHIVQINIFPNISECYDKETQVNLDEVYETEKETDLHQTPHRRTRSESAAPHPNFQPSSPIRQRAPSTTSEPDNIVANIEEKKKKYSTEEVNTILKDDSFKTFVKSSSHIMLRALGLSNSIDILKDYTGANRGNYSNNNQKAIMSKTKHYFDLSVQDRPIMDIQVSPHHAELFLVAYGAKPNVESRSEHSQYDNHVGLLCLWSIILTDLPEFTFTAPSPVLVARFHPDDPHIIVGGCYSGQIVVWDTRVSSHRPTIKSAIAGKGHKHPVYSMCLVKSGASSPTLVTASTDGTLCHWDLTNLNDPISTTNLSAPSIASINPLSHATDIISTPSYMLVNNSNTTRGKPISASCMGLSSDEENRKLIIGTEGGSLCIFTLPFKPNVQFEQVGAHYGMVTSITVNPSPSKLFKDLILTSSVDWTVKLWNIKKIGVPPSPIFVFSGSVFDYYCSVRWCPTHPGIFTTITSGGVLMLWNLCQSLVEPIGTINLHNTDKDSNSSSSGNNSSNSTNNPSTTTSTTATTTLSSSSTSSSVISGTNTLPPSIPSISTTTSTSSSSLLSSSSTHTAFNKIGWLQDGCHLLVGDFKGNVNMVSIRSNIVALRSDDEMKLEYSLESSGLKISSISTNSIRGLSSAIQTNNNINNSKDILDDYSKNISVDDEIK